jgi:hypothetical protein
MAGTLWVPEKLDEGVNLGGSVWGDLNREIPEKGTCDE